MPTSSFSVTYKPAVLKAGDFLCLPWRDKRKPAFSLADVPGAFGALPPPEKSDRLQVAFVGEFAGKRMAVATRRLDDPNASVDRSLKRTISAALAEARKLSMKRVVVVLDNSHAAFAAAVQEGALLGGYVFDQYKSKKTAPLPVLLALQSDDQGAIKAALKKGEAICDCVNFARDVLNEPPSTIHPGTLAEAAVAFGAEAGLQMEVWDHKKLAKEKCGGILAVGQGSSTPPCLVIGQFAPKGALRHLALVGKGVTFDSGGYCLKPPKSQEDMKFDMAGAAMMLAAAAAIARLGMPIKVTCLLPLAHNAISGNAYNVSDVIRTRSGQTVEVENTDAEGRIILADALTIALERKPDYLIDSATLTGAAVVALGEDIGAVYGNDTAFTKKLLEASAVAGEDLWELPLFAAYNKEYDSPIADMKNSGARYGGSICAALFLKRFVKDFSLWIHMDIAGPAGKMGPLEHLGKGAKGFGVKTIVALAETLSKA